MIKKVQKSAKKCKKTQISENNFIFNYYLKSLKSVKITKKSLKSVKSH